MSGYLSINMMSSDLRDAMLCTCFFRTYWKKIIVLNGKMYHLSSIIKIKKSFKWLNPLSHQSCLTLICLQVFIAFPVILRKILSRNFISNDPFSYFCTTNKNTFLYNILYNKCTFIHLHLQHLSNIFVQHF